MTWHPKTQEDSLGNQSSRIAEYYEQQIEKEPLNTDYYWHLGLAYLLLGREEEAQLTWFLVLGQCEGEDLERQAQSLTAILDAEAERFEREANYQTAWLIRGHLREITPNDYNNFLCYVCLDIITSHSAIEKIQEWSLSELLLSIPQAEISKQTIERLLSCVAQIPSPESIAVIRHCLETHEDCHFFISVIVGSIQNLIQEREYPKYIIEVMYACLKYEPYNLSLINVIFVLYTNFNEFDSAIQIGKKALEKSQNITEKIFSNYQLINTILKISNWQDALKIADQYLSQMSNFLGQKIDDKHPFITNSFIIVNQPIYHLRDNPTENRLIGNYISQAFQNTFLTHTSVKNIPIQRNLSHQRPLKIGYIGHTLCAHPVGFLSRWLIHHADRDHIKNYAYMFSDRIDDFAQQWFLSNMESYKTSARDVQLIINEIQADEIDILIDLDSWTYDLTCQVMALKPAPIQVTWLGFDASGIPNVDYFIADPFVLPPEADTYYSEKIWRLPHCYLCIDGFEVGAPTLKRKDLHIPDDAVIFANYQNALKRHPSILRQQMKILKGVPNSYLLVKGTGQADIIQSLFEGIAEEEGVSLDRLRFLEPCATEREHRANLGLVDVMLDTYPYNGATTTLETLWMEIPLVTRVGEQFAARNSYTFMINAGITEGIAWTDEEYVEWGIRLGTDENLRKEISWKLKQSKKTSPLWKGKQFAREMEAAYRQMWEQYLAST